MSDQPDQSALEWVETEALVDELARRSAAVVVAFQLKSDKHNYARFYRHGHLLTCLGLARGLYRNVDDAVAESDVDDEEEAI